MRNDKNVWFKNRIGQYETDNEKFVIKPNYFDNKNDVLEKEWKLYHNINNSDKEVFIGTFQTVKKAKAAAESVEDLVSCPDCPDCHTAILRNDIFTCFECGQIVEVE